MKTIVIAACVCFVLLERVVKVVHGSNFNSSDLDSDRNLCNTLYLLNVVPYPDNGTFAGWDRGFELIPAGHLATRHINNDPSILPGYKLEVIDVASEACGRSLITEGYLEYFRQTQDPRGCAFGVVGLYCSTVTNTIAPIANHPNIGYVQLAASTTPLHRNSTTFPFTFHSISSSSIFNNAMVALMDEFSWTRVSIVFDSLGFFFRSTGADFTRLIKSEGDKVLTATIAIQPQIDSINSIFDTINNEEARIVYFSVSEGQIATYFCEAYKRQFLWPGYVYVLQERSLQQIHLTPVDCTPDQLTEALEGTFLLQYRLSASDTTNLVSGLTYGEFFEQYAEEVEMFAQETGMTLENNPYANSLYDQVWAFALAANLSLESTNFTNSSIPRRAVQHSIAVREIIAKRLNDIEFEGASGYINFGEEREVLTSVEIYQVQNGTEVLVGEYDAFNERIVLRSHFDRESVPEDTFEVRYQLVPQWVGIVFLLANACLLVLATFNTILTVHWRHKPEIKSGSYSLSLIILTGCYILCISPFFKVVLAIFVLTESTVITILCNIQLWSFIVGNFLIFVTLLVRLFRVFHVFRSYHATGKYWSDKFLVLYISLIFSIMVVLLIAWTVVDPYRHFIDRNYIPSGQPPYYLVHNYCSCDNLGVWLAVSFSLIGIVMILLVFLAIQTRHIKHKHFKDTKKVNIFIFSVCGIYAIFLPLWLVLSNVDIETGAFVCLIIANLSGAALCQAFLFLPKVIPAFRSKKKVTLKTTRRGHSRSHSTTILVKKLSYST